MTARSLFAALAAAYFLFLALTFIAPGASQVRQHADDGTSSWELEGDTASLAVTSAVRTIAAGLVLVSLAVIEWRVVTDKIRGDA